MLPVRADEFAAISLNNPVCGPYKRLDVVTAKSFVWKHYKGGLRENTTGRLPASTIYWLTVW